MPFDALVWAVVAGVLASLACGLGIVPLMVPSWDPKRHQGMGYAVASGLMFAASVINLLFPAVLMDGDPSFAWQETLWIVGGMLLGAGFLAIVEHKLHAHDAPGPADLAKASAEEAGTGEAVTEEGGIGKGWGGRVGLLVFIAMTFHSIPEGVAVGTAFASDASGAAAEAGMMHLGPAVALAIGIHNMPEGLAVAIPMRSAGVSLWRCFWAAVLTSLPQPIAAVPAVLLAWFFQPLMPFLMAFAAGAMIFLIILELIPEALERESGSRVAWGFMFGFCGMVLIQVIL